MALNPDEIRQRSRMEWQVASQGWKKWEKQILGGLEKVSNQLIQSAGISPGQHVLDIASGTGEPALTIAKHVGPQGKVVGVDLSPAMLEVAKERATSKGVTNADFQVVEDENLTAYRDATFDSVVCRFGLMLMPNPVNALKAFLRVLKPRGKAAVSVWGPPEKSPFMGLVMQTLAKHLPDFKPPPPGAPGFSAIPSVALLGEYFSKAGFSNFEGETTDSFTIGQTDSVDEIWELMSEATGSLAILLPKLPNEKRQAIKSDVVGAIRTMFPSGPVKFVAELIVGAGARP